MRRALALLALLLGPVVLADHDDRYPDPPFGGVGLARPPPRLVIEGEDLGPGATGRVVEDPSASGGKAWDIDEYGHAATTLVIEDPGIVWMTVRARGTHPEGMKNAHFHVNVDGIQRSEGNLNATWWDYAQPYVFIPGTYRLDVENFDNHYGRAAGERRVVVDSITVSRSSLDRVPSVGAERSLEVEGEFVHEAETGVAKSDPDASGGRYWWQWGTGCLSEAVIVEDAGTYEIVSRTSGDEPGGVATRTQLLVDEVEVDEWDSLESWTQHATRVALAPGVHTVRFCYDNDGPGDEKRTLRLDAFGLAWVGPAPVLDPPDDEPPPRSSTAWRLPHASLANERRVASAIDARSAPRLAEVWRVETGGPVTGTPVHAGGVVYAADWLGTLRALALDDGALLWERTLPAGVDSTLALDGDRLLVADRRGNLSALDRADGRTLWSVRVDEADRTHLYGSPVVHDGVVYLGVASDETMVRAGTASFEFRGSVQAFDARTGERRWRAYTQADDARGVSVWSTPAIDPELGLLFVGTGNAYGPPAGDLSDAVVALRLADGSLAWSFQATAGDTYSGNGTGGFDRDLGSSPVLASAGGRDLVVEGDKGGRLFALDRRTGELAWKTTVDFKPPDATPESREGFVGTPALAGGVLFAPTSARGLVHAVDLTTGERRWATEVNGFSFVYDMRMFGATTATQDIVVQGSAYGHVLVLAQSDGRVVANLSTGRPVHGGVSVAGDTLLVPLSGRPLWDERSGGGLVAFRLPSPAGGPPPDDDPPEGDGRALPPVGATSPIPGPGAAFAAVAAVLARAMLRRGRKCHQSVGHESP